MMLDIPKVVAQDDCGRSLTPSTLAITEVTMPAFGMELDSFMELDAESQTIKIKNRSALEIFLSKQTLSFTVRATVEDATIDTSFSIYYISYGPEFIPLAEVQKSVSARNADTWFNVVPPVIEQMGQVVTKALV